jgi:23S rRNA (uracil1939-C5)-methyltransferase
MHCSHHPACPGCPLLDRSYPEQLELKRARLQAAFAFYPHLPEVPPVAPAAFTEGYRHRLKLPVETGRDGTRVGLYDRGTGRVLDTPDCPVLEPGLRDALGVIRGWMKGKADIHSVDLRRSAATGELQVVFACVGGDLPGGPRGARGLMRSLPALTSLAVSRADPERKRVMGQDAKVLAGKPFIEEAIGSVRYRLHPGAFFQVDPRTAELLHGIVRDAVGEANRVLDLYAGVGAYALMLAEGRTSVLAVEEVAAAARSAREMAPPNVKVIEGRVEDVDLGHKVEATVINPARRGSDPATLARLAHHSQRIIYVSCGPETLARDLDCLAANGMRLRGLWPIDLFPQTAEVETVALLERGHALESWSVPGGKARGPWRGEPSGAIGRPERLIALAIGDTGESGNLPGGHYRRVATIATHSLVRIELEGAPIPALASLSRRGHPIAGRDPRTARFFADKAGLVRPFLHVERAGKVKAPLHGDLLQALEALGADERLLSRVRG